MPKRVKDNKSSVLNYTPNKSRTRQAHIPSSQHSKFPELEKSWARLSDRQKKFLLLMTAYPTESEAMRVAHSGPEAREGNETHSGVKYFNNALIPAYEGTSKFADFRNAYMNRERSIECDAFVRHLWERDIALRLHGGDDSLKDVFKSIKDTGSFLDSLDPKIMNADTPSGPVSGIPRDSITALPSWLEEEYGEEVSNE